MLIQWGMCCSFSGVGNKVEHRGVKLIHPPVNGKMSNLPCAPLSVAVGELLCVDSSPVPVFHFVALLMLTLFPTGLCLTWMEMTVSCSRYIWKEDTCNFKRGPNKGSSFERSCLPKLEYYQRTWYRKDLTDASDWSQNKISPTSEDMFSSFSTPPLCFILLFPLTFFMHRAISGLLHRNRSCC